MLEKADARLRKEAASGGSDPFAVIVVFHEDVFLERSESLASSPWTVLNELGKAAILLLRPGQVVPLLKDPSVRKAAWFGPQGLLARLDPTLELSMLAAFGAGEEGRDVDLFVRLLDTGGPAEERHISGAGFRIGIRAGPSWIVTGPMSGIPGLLESDRIIYLEGTSKARGMPR